LIHLVDASGAHAGAAYRIIRGELAAYGGGLAEKPEIVALSKIDAVDEETLKVQRERLKRAMRTYGPPLAAGARRAPPLELSAVAHRGVVEALRAALAVIDTARTLEAKQSAPAPVWTA
jgi:GTP-binding protein